MKNFLKIFLIIAGSFLIGIIAFALKGVFPFEYYVFYPKFLLGIFLFLIIFYKFLKDKKEFILALIIFSIIFSGFDIIMDLKYYISKDKICHLKYNQ